MRLVYGVGINDKSGFSGSKEYQLWADILRRCDNTRRTSRQKSYDGCTISENFKSFSYFYDWCQDQVGFGISGFQIDKDLLIKGNKVYGEDNCIFLPYKINGALEKCKGLRGDMPIGVYIEKRTGLIKSNVRIDGKQVLLGVFSNEVEAFMAYKAEKEKYLKRLANDYIDQLDTRAYYALLNYNVDIDD